MCGQAPAELCRSRVACWSIRVQDGEEIRCPCDQDAETPSRGRDAPPTVWAVGADAGWVREKGGYGDGAVVQKPWLHRGKLGGGRDGKAKP